MAVSPLCDNDRAVEPYLEHGADPNQRVPWHNAQGHLHKAVIQRRSLRTLRALLGRGADPNLPDAHGLSPYRYAVRLGQVEMVELLAAHGTNLDEATAEERAKGALDEWGPEPRRPRGGAPGSRTTVARGSAE